MTSIHDQLIGLFTRLEALGLGRPRLKHSPLSLPQFGLLASIWRNPGTRVNDIAETLGVSKPTVSVALNKLEKAGWLRRKLDPDDRRSVRLYLSTKANLLASQVLRHRRKRINEFMSGLTESEQTQLLNLLDKAITHLEDKHKPETKERVGASLRSS
jgi:DNA-binding MarR family transcriptional regulator